MSHIFFLCSSLKELKLSNFNTNNVTDMNGMFFECRGELEMKIRMQYKNIKEEVFSPYLIYCSEDCDSEDLI